MRTPTTPRAAWPACSIPKTSFDAHVEDTLRSGDGLCHRDVVELLRRARGPSTSCVSPASSASTSTATPRATSTSAARAGTRARRVAHAKDIDRLGHPAGAARPRGRARAIDITILPDHMAVDLLTSAKYGGPNAVFGAYVLDQKTGEVKTVVARATVLATGGAGKVYLYTTNPDVATGDGVAMAYRVGARVANMEFIQFHPTCLYHPQAKSFLITEALRGEGGILRLRDGTAFMGRYHAMKELAPRDVVARAIDAELKRTGDDYVVLDMTHLPRRLPRRALPDHPPALPRARHRHAHAADPGRARGALQVRRRRRRRARPHHGAQPLRHRRGGDDRPPRRLPPGLELAARGAWSSPPAPPTTCAASSRAPGRRSRPWYAGDAGSSDEAVVITQNWDEIRRLMWNYVGIVRTDKRLERARAASSSSAPRSASTTGTSSHRRSARAAQPRARRRPDHRVARAGARRAAACTSTSTTPTKTSAARTTPSSAAATVRWFSRYRVGGQACPSVYPATHWQEHVIG